MSGRSTLHEITSKLASFCASRDRSHSEVRTKLLSLKVYGDDLEEIISHLITEGFLNEERYARNFARGKLRINKWGRNKIVYALRSKKIPDYSIQKGLAEIDEEEYNSILDDLVRKQVKGQLTMQTRQKIVASLMRKGFESGLILERLKTISENQKKDSRER